MKMTVAFNGDMDLLPRLAEYKDVESIFVKMTEDLTGGGRSSFALPDIDLEKLKEIVEVAHKHGIKVNYVFNSACQANDEFSLEYSDSLFELINNLSDIGIDGAVVSSPYMMGFIKKNWPHIWVTVSIFAFADNVQKAKFWDERGADRVILPMIIGRDFEVLKKIRESIKCEIELIANLGCLSTCPMDRFHSAFVSHNSRTPDRDNRFLIDYHVINCALLKMREPAELLKSRWIRPEDVTAYEQIGIDTIKITDRLKNTPWMINVVNAYQNRRYDGNLIDLIHVSYFFGELNTELASNPKRGGLVNVNNISKELLGIYRSCKQIKMQIDNNKLNDFLEYFKKVDCSKLNCGVDCRYCYKKAEDVMSYNKDEVEQNVQLLTKVMEKIHNRSMFA